MKLNDFLGFRLGVEFEDKYNMLAIKEVLNNKDKYPNIYPYILNEIYIDDNDLVEEREYDFQFFDCDDDTCAGAVETLELNKVFSLLLLKEVMKGDLEVKRVSFGKDFVIYPSIGCVQNPNLNYKGITYITIKKSSKIIGKEIYKHNIVDGERFGHLSTNVNYTLYYEDNRNLFDELNQTLTKFDLDALYDLVNQRFTNEDLLKLETELDGEKCYFLANYEIQIGNNLLKLNTTDVGFDPLGLFRMRILESLTEEQKENEVVKLIGIF